MKLSLVILLFALVPNTTQAQTKSLESEIEAIFSELRDLKPMTAGERYTLPVRGENVTGVGDDFLRRRTVSEVEASGLSCGCGDYALVFIDRIESRGFDTLVIDSAQISLASLESHDSGHVVVAVRPKDQPGAHWWLVDSTARNILSRDWSSDARSFTASGYVYWIGYCGTLALYPIHNHEELKQFYLRVLTSIPPEVLNNTFYHFTFSVDRSLDGGHGGYLNPRIPRLRANQDAAFARYHIVPERDITILLTRGADDSSGMLSLIDGRWVAGVGLKSACSASLLDYFAQRIRFAEAER